MYGCVLNLLSILLTINQVFCNGYLYGIDTNITSVSPDARQLLDFKLQHPKPIGLWTTSSGIPVEIRDTTTFNSINLSNRQFIDSIPHITAETIPERVVHAKAGAAFGYLIVTNDVSKYTMADLFNGVGKKTKTIVRFSVATQNLGGNDLARDVRGMAMKFYSKGGNFDLLALQTPVYFYRDPIRFHDFVHAFKRNPNTNLFDSTARWDFITRNPDSANAFFRVLADDGIPKGYTKMDSFPIHTYEIYNKDGKTHYVRFNFRTLQGRDNYTSAEAAVIGGLDPDRFNRELYNTIASKIYPEWRVEMDVMTSKDIENVGYNPFDVSRQWTKGTFKTVVIGKLVLNKNVENFHADAELASFNPGNIVPGINNPPDLMFRGRNLAYPDTQNYRLGRNHNKITINAPEYAKTYLRDGVPPVRSNMKDAPNYHSNSFNGPIPYVDGCRPKKSLIILESTAADLQPVSDYYNQELNEDAKQRFTDNLALGLLPVTKPVLENALKLLHYIDLNLGKIVVLKLAAAKATQAATMAIMNPTTLKPIIKQDTAGYEDYFNSK